MSIKAFDKPNLKMLRNEIDDALKHVAEKHGIRLSLGNISFTATTFTGKLEALISDGNAEDLDSNIKWQKNFLTYAPLYGLSKDDLGRTFTYANKEYKIVGAMGGKAMSQQIIVKREGAEKAQRMDAETVKILLKNKE